MAKQRPYPVQIGSERYVVSELETTQPLRWQELLAAAKHQQLAPVCRCRGGEGVALEIRGSGSKLFLKRKAHTGHLHIPACLYYKDRPETSGLRYYAADIIRPIADRVALPRPTATASEAPSDAAGNRRDVSLQGLLSLLWHQAQLDAWINGWQRPAHDVIRRLRAARHELKFDDTPAEQVLAVVPAGGAVGDEPLWHSLQHEGEAMVLGFLGKSPAEQLSFRGDQGQRIYIASAAWSAIQRTAPYAFAEWQAGRQVAALALVRKEASKRYLRCDTLALTALTRRYLPTRSPAQTALLEHLLEQDRSLSVPLAYDAPPEAIMPAAILTDTENRDTPLFIAPANSDGAWHEYASTVFRHARPWFWAGQMPIPELPAPTAGRPL